MFCQYRRFVIRSSDETYQCSSVHLMCHILRNASASLSDTHNDTDGDHESKETKDGKTGSGGGHGSKSKKPPAREAFGVTVTQAAIVQLMAQLLPVLCRDAASIIIAAVSPDHTGTFTILCPLDLCQEL